MDYPGRVIKQGETDARIVKAIKQQLNRVLTLSGADAVKLDAANPNFGPQMKQAVQLFQARHVDSQGRALKPDGELGSISWAALFGAASAPAAHTAADDYLARVLQVAGAAADAEVREQPVNSNDGPEVRAYLRSVGLGPGFAWCCAFTYWCCAEAATALGRGNPVVRTAGVLAHWAGAPAAGARRVQRHQAVADPSLVSPGMMLIMDFGGGKGHTGFVERVEDGHIATIEGNTDASKTREGGGVYRLTRKLVDINKGFIDYAGL